MNEAENGDLLAGIPAEVTRYLAAPSSCGDAICDVVAAGHMDVREFSTRVFAANLTAVELQAFCNALTARLGPDGLARLVVGSAPVARARACAI